MARQPNIFGGGAQTNINGLTFERNMDLLTVIDALPNFHTVNNKIYLKSNKGDIKNVEEIFIKSVGIDEILANENIDNIINKLVRYKIKESERKLEKTLANMKEVELLRRENAPHLNFLRKQLEKLEKAKAALKALEEKAYATEIDDLIKGQNIVSAFNVIKANASTGVIYVNIQYESIDSTNIIGTVAIAQGGTNTTTTPTAGAVAYGTGTAYAFTATGTSGQFLQSNGSGTPTWATPSQSAPSVRVAPAQTTAAAAPVMQTELPIMDQIFTIHPRFYNEARVVGKNIALANQFS